MAAASPPGPFSKKPRLYEVDQAALARDLVPPAVAPSHTSGRLHSYRCGEVLEELKQLAVAPIWHLRRHSGGGVDFVFESAETKAAISCFSGRWPGLQLATFSRQLVRVDAVDRVFLIRNYASAQLLDDGVVGLTQPALIRYWHQWLHGDLSKTTWNLEYSSP